MHYNRVNTIATGERPRPKTAAQENIMIHNGKDIPDSAILSYIENSDKFKGKIIQRLKEIDITPASFSDGEILDYIETNPRLLGKTKSRIAKINGSTTTLTPEQRSQRATKAAQARWKKDK